MPRNIHEHLGFTTFDINTEIIYFSRADSQHNRILWKTLNIHNMFVVDIQFGLCYLFSNNLSSYAILTKENLTPSKKDTVMIHI